MSISTTFMRDGPARARCAPRSVSATPRPARHRPLGAVAAAHAYAQLRNLCGRDQTFAQRFSGIRRHSRH
jgi:hypothetical protein